MLLLAKTLSINIIIITVARCEQLSTSFLAGRPNHYELKNHTQVFKKSLKFSEKSYKFSFKIIEKFKALFINSLWKRVHTSKETIIEIRKM